MTGRHRNGIQRGLRELIAEGVIVQVAPPSFDSPAVLALNKDYEKWGKWSVDSHTLVEEAQDEEEAHYSVGGEAHQSVGGQAHYSVGGEAHQSVPIEDIYTGDASTTARARERLVTLARETIPGWKPHSRDGPVIASALEAMPESDVEQVIRKLAIHQAANGKYQDLRRALANWLKTEYTKRGGNGGQARDVSGRSIDGEW